MGRRLLSIAAALAILAGYLLVATLVVALLTALWASPPDLPTAIATVVVAALVTGYLSYRFASVRVRSTLQAVELTEGRAPGVHGRLAALADAMDVATPTVFVARLPTPNALSVGGPRGTIVLDDRLLGMLDGDELEALLAHELAHLESKDTLLQTLAYSLAQLFVVLVAIVVLPFVLVTGLLARAWALVRGHPGSWERSVFGRLQVRSIQGLSVLGLVATLVLLAYSRQREYAADDRAVSVTGKPLALARTLVTIDRAADPDRGLITPLLVTGDDDHPLSDLLSTHPPMDERVDRLVRRADRDGPTLRR